MMNKQIIEMHFVKRSKSDYQWQKHNIKMRIKIIFVRINEKIVLWTTSILMYWAK